MVLKGLNKYIRFLFVTGASKFAKIALFSGPNNLRDITYDEDFNELCGFTWPEIEKTYSIFIDELAVHYGMSKEEIHKYIRSIYNGYSWSVYKQKSVYNPWSICALIKTGRFYLVCYLPLRTMAAL